MNKLTLIAVWVLPSILLLGITSLSRSDVIRALGNDALYRSAEEQAYVRSLILQKYVEEVRQEDLLEGAIHGMIDVLGDRYSEYLNEKRYQQLMEGTAGSYVGIGVTIDLSADGKIQIVSTQEDTPAYRAGVLPGDVIVAIDGLRRKSMTITDAVGRIKGQKGTKVILTLSLRGTEPEREVTIARDRIHVSSVKGVEILDPDAAIGYMRITGFSDDTGPEARAGLEDLLDKGARSLILDLRNNGGGRFESCREVIDLFVSEGVMVSTVGRNKEDKESFAASEKTSRVGSDFPLVVLVNGSSASASEIVAAALQDLKRAQLVGTRTFGKGLVQQIIGIGKETKTALKLTTSYWLRPNGNKITPTQPVEPDVEVILSDIVWKELLRMQIEGEAYRRPDTLDADPVDTQLRKAIELLRNDAD